MGRTVNVIVRCEYEDTIDVDKEDEHLTDAQLHDKFADEAQELFRDAVREGWHDITSIQVEVVED